jgi:hypothetical protein
MIAGWSTHEMVLSEFFRLCDLVRSVKSEE